MTYDRHVVIVVPRADVADANTRMRDDDPTTDDRTFTVPLSATGALPWTHSWCCWRVTPALATKLKTRVDALVARGWKFYRLLDKSGQGKTREAILVLNGLQTIGGTP